MEWIINQLRVHPELAIFLTLFAGFWLGRLKIGKFSLGTVTSVLLVGVLVGQLNITVDGPLKAVFFLLFLFAVGYKVGPQFFRGLKKDGLPQVGFAVLMCIVSLVAPWILAKIMGYHIGEAVGLLAGSAWQAIRSTSWASAKHRRQHILMLFLCLMPSLIFSVQLVLPGFWLLSVRSFSADWIK